MKKRIILHIGAPKCGSTYLQRVMIRNRDALRTQGIGYPDDGLQHPGNATQLGRIDRAFLDSAFGEDVHTVLLSQENLIRRLPRGETLAALAPKMGIEVQVVAFWRPYSAYMFGVYSERLKENFETLLKTRAPFDGQSFEGFAAHLYEVFDIVKCLRDWQALFPERPLMLRPHQTIKETISEVFGPEVNLSWELPRALSNPSMRMQDCDAIVAALRHVDMPETTLCQMMTEARANGHLDDAGKTPQRTEWLQSLHATRNAELFRLFGYANA